MSREDRFPSFTSRRQFLLSAGTIGASAWLVPSRLLSSDAPHLGGLSRNPGPVEQMRKAAETAPIRIQKLRGNLSALIGNGGNVVALQGNDGVLLIDAGIVGARVAETVARITRTPIRHLINTHWHFDHTDANDWHHAHGAAILAHEMTRTHMATTTRVEDWKFTFPPSPAGAIPATVFADERDVRLNESLVQLKHYPPAHTDGDIWAHFTDVDVLHVGDTWWNGLYPFVDQSTGGSIDGMIGATERNLAKTSDKTIIVPGHGPVGGKADLIEFRDMLIALREKVAGLKKQGKSLEEILMAKPTADYDEKWGRYVIDGKTFTALVYQGV